MILTEETLQGWRSNPITAEIVKRVKQAVLAEQASSNYNRGQNTDSYGLHCAYSQGVIDGAKSFLEAFDNLNFEVEEEEEENNEL